MLKVNNKISRIVKNNIFFPRKHFFWAGGLYKIKFLFPIVTLFIFSDCVTGSEFIKNADFAKIHSGGWAYHWECRGAADMFSFKNGEATLIGDDKILPIMISTNPALETAKSYIISFEVKGEIDNRFWVYYEAVKIDKTRTLPNSNARKAPETWTMIMLKLKKPENCVRDQFVFRLMKPAAVSFRKITIQEIKE